MIPAMGTVERYDIYEKLCKRAENAGVKLERTTLIMDIESADRKFNLRLDELLTAKDADFMHDIAGIINNINRADGFPATDFGLFVPRFAGNDL